MAADRGEYDTESQLWSGCILKLTPTNHNEMKSTSPERTFFLECKLLEISDFNSGWNEVQVCFGWGSGGSVVPACQSRVNSVQWFSWSVRTMEGHRHQGRPQYLNGWVPVQLGRFNTQDWLECVMDLCYLCRTEHAVNSALCVPSFLFF